MEQNKRVVVIGEDDEPIARLHDAINDEAGHQAMIVPDGAVVLETVRQVHADLLILDVMMPGLTGVDLLAKVRRLCPA